MQAVFVGNRNASGNPSALLKRHTVNDFSDFCKQFLETCSAGSKSNTYLTIADNVRITPGNPDKPNSYLGTDHYHRNNLSQLSAWLLPFDGDNSKSKPGSCIDPKLVHETLKRLNLTHCIYTTHSHITGKRNRWRLFLPCKLKGPNELRATVEDLYKMLVRYGCKDLAPTTESKTWSQPWFLPTRTDPSDGHFQYFIYTKGVEYVAVKGPKPSKDSHDQRTDFDQTASDILEVIKYGLDGLHPAMNKFIYGAVRDGRPPAWIKAELHVLTSDYDPADKRLMGRKKDIDRLVDYACKKHDASCGIDDDTDYTDYEYDCEETELGDDEKSPSELGHTIFPDQGGQMEKLVEYAMDWMLFPDRSIATVAAHALISVLGGRVYSYDEEHGGTGIVYTALVTGDSTVGKSNMRKFCAHMFNSFSKFSPEAFHDFNGAFYYTSVKNFLKDLERTGSIISFRSESGQTDMSQAGDMPRVRAFELELATNSGILGSVSAGGQNDRIRALCSPAVTTIRESVAEIQNEADMMLKTSINGMAGRRSHIILPKHRGYKTKSNVNIPTHFVSMMTEMYARATKERNDIYRYLAKDKWIVLNYEKDSYLDEKENHWIKKYNEYADHGDDYMRTFYGRLFEKVPAYAGRLAVTDDWNHPVVTTDHIDIAERSLLAEAKAFRNRETKETTGDLVAERISSIMANRILTLKSLRTMTTKPRKNETKAQFAARKQRIKRDLEKMVCEGCVPRARLFNMLQSTEHFRNLKAEQNYEYKLDRSLSNLGIVPVPRKLAVDRYNFSKKVYTCNPKIITLIDTKYKFCK